MTEDIKDILKRLNTLERKVESIEDRMLKDYTTVKILDKNDGVVHEIGREILKEVRKSNLDNPVTTNDIHSIYRNNGMDPSRSTVSRKAKKFADFFDWIELRKGYGSRPHELYNSKKTN